MKRFVVSMGLCVALVASGGCKKDEPKPAETKPPAAKPEGPDKPAAKPGEAAEVPADAAEPKEPAAEVPSADTPDVTAEAPASGIESTDILSRKPATQKAIVKHILIGWAELEPAYRGTMDPRAKARTKAEADTLAASLLEKVRAGEDMDALMKASSEDPGSAATGRAYTAAPDSPLVEPFKHLALRIEVGEAGLVQSPYGWHVIVRTE